MKGKKKVDEFEETKKEIERAMVQTIKEMSNYISAITSDLEEKEEERLEIKPDLEIIWKGSTFKVEFIEKCALNLLSTEKLIKYYITVVWPMKKWILGKNEKFFIKGRKFLFPGVKADDINFFINLWKVQGVLTKDEKETIWNFWKNLIDITEDWKDHTQWEPSEKDNLKDLGIDYREAEKLMEEDSDSE